MDERKRFTTPQADPPFLELPAEGPAATASSVSASPATEPGGGAAGAASSPSRLPGLRVGLFDDSFVSSVRTREVLEKSGQSVEHITNVASLCAADWRGRLDIVLIDQSTALPVEDYYALVSALYRLFEQWEEEIPVVMLLDGRRQQYADPFRRLGVDTVVVKPLTVALPVLLEETVRAFRERPLKGALARRLNICVVEDSYATAQRIQGCLADTGHWVDYCPDGQSGLAALSQKPYDAVLLGPNEALSTMTGIDFIRSVRALPGQDRQRTPLYVLTGANNNLDLFIKAGADRVVVTGSSDDLTETLQRVIGPGRLPVKADIEALIRQARDGGVTPTAPVAAAGEEGMATFPSPDKAPAGAVTSPPPDGEFDPHAKWSRISVAVASVLLIVAVAVWGVQQWWPAGEPVTAVAPGQRIATAPLETVRGVSPAEVFRGRVVSRKQVNLTVSRAGQISDVFVEENMPVVKGAVLAKLDDREAVLAVEMARNKVERAELMRRDAETALRQVEMALQQGSVSSQVAIGARRDVEAAKNQLTAAQAELHAAQLRLERSRIVAPFAGTVIHSYAVEGLWAEPPGALFTLADTRMLEVRFRVPALDHGFAAGQTVYLTSDVFPGQRWRETVTYITPADRAEGDGAFEFVHLSLSDTAPPLRYGHPVEIARLPDALGR